MSKLILAALAGSATTLAALWIRKLMLLPGKDWNAREDLAAGKIKICDLPLSRVYLMDDANYPAWLVLVPRLDGLREIIDLPPSLQEKLWEEVAAVSKVTKELFKPFKLNVATIGNVVDQLHVHVTARNPSDPSWPGPCYGAIPAIPVEASLLEQTKHDINEKLRVYYTLP